MIVKQHYVDGPDAACPVEDCGLGVSVRQQGKRWVTLAACRHFIQPERVGTRVILVFADSPED